METILILHGWGISGEKYKEVKQVLEGKGYRVLTPDFPGFGKETLRKQAMTVNDYVEFVKKYIQGRKLQQVIIIGHSFGGRIAAVFAATYPGMVSKLILTGAPLIKQPLSLKKRAIQVFAKGGKKVLFLFPQAVQNIVRKATYRFIGEWDYYKAGSLTDTFKNVIAQDLKSFVPRIKAPTGIIWGEQDTFVPLSVGKQIHAQMRNSHFTVIPQASHKLPYEHPRVFAKYVLEFLQHGK